MESLVLPGSSNCSPYVCDCSSLGALGEAPPEIDFKFMTNYFNRRVALLFTFLPLAFYSHSFAGLCCSFPCRVSYGLCACSSSPKPCAKGPSNCDEL